MFCVRTRHNAPSESRFSDQSNTSLALNSLVVVVVVVVVAVILVINVVIEDNNILNHLPICQIKEFRHGWIF